MPVGIALGGAAIAGAATVASGAMASHAQSKAANKASNTASATADKNNALQREIYGENKALLSPYSSNGLLASNALTDLLLGTHSFNPTAATAPAGGATTPSTGGTAAGGAFVPHRDFGGFPGALQDVAINVANRDRGGPANRAMFPSGEHQVPVAGAVTTPAAAPATAGGTPSALSAWDQFRQGTNYNWRFNEGMRGVTGAYATRGALDSGAAERAKITYGQNFASNELSNYMNLLAGQQGMGLSAASAVAGVGQNYAGNVAAQNTNAGNAAANAALVAGQGQANMWGSVGQGVGQLGGALFQYGMGQARTPAPVAGGGWPGSF